MYEKVWKNLIKPILILLLSLWIIIPNTITHMDQAELLKIGLETNALVTHVSSSRAGTIADVRYTAGNQKYHSTMKVKGGGRFKQGDTETILYHPENPEKITLKNREDANDKPVDLLIVSVPAIRLLIYSVVALILSFIRRRRT